MIGAGLIFGSALAALVSIPIVLVNEEDKDGPHLERLPIAVPFGFVAFCVGFFAGYVSIKTIIEWPSPSRSVRAPTESTPLLTNQNTQAAPFIVEQDPPLRVN